MRRLIIFLLILVASVWIGMIVVRHPGYLLLVTEPWVMEMPLWFALIAAAVFLLIFYILVDSIDRLAFFWFRIKNWLRFRREHKLYSKTQHGLALLIEARWQKAEKLLLAGADQSIEPLMNYLGAARAAQEQGSIGRRDEYIRQAYKVAPKAAIAIGVTQAELEIEKKQYELAAATLNQVLQKSPRHPRVLRLLEKAYIHLGAWPQLVLLLPKLRKAKLLTAEQFTQFEKNVYCEILNVSKYKSLQDLQKLWQQIPRGVRKNPDVVCAYVKQLLRYPQANTVEELIRSSLKSAWQPELVKIYGTLPIGEVNKQLVVAGAWLKLYGPKPELLLTLGRLCMRAQLWGRAKDYFTKCLAFGPNTEAALEYGRLLEQLDDPKEALKKYRDGLVRVEEEALTQPAV